MATPTNWIAAAAVGGVLTLGTVAAKPALQQQARGINVDSVVTQLGVTGQTRDQLTARLNDINAQLAESDSTAAYCYNTWQTLGNLDLTPAQWRQLHQALWDAGAIGMGRYGGMMGMHGSAWGGAMHGGYGMRGGYGMHGGRGMQGSRGMHRGVRMGRPLRGDSL